MEDKTRTKTLWTETLLENLFEALRRNKSDGAIKKVLAELREKDIPTGYMVQKTRSEVGPREAKRLELLLAAASKARRGAAPRSGNRGLLSAVKKFFK